MRENHLKQFLMFGIIAAILASSGCTKSEDVTAPSESTIEVNGESSFDGISADTTVNFTVVVKDGNGVPLNGAEIFISGSFAVPRNSTGNVVRYQFYRRVNGIDPVNSGFSAKTDENGVYEFSALIYAIVGGAATSFSDNIMVSSGTAYASHGISVD